MATSGDYLQGFDVGARHYSNCIDPRTGTPIDNGVRSVTVLHASCMEADAWSTALMVLGPDAGLDFAVKHELAALVLFRHGDAVTELTTPALDAMLA